MPWLWEAVCGNRGWWHSKIITSDEYGLLCKPGDDKDLTQKILIALDKKWNGNKIGAYANTFTWDNIAKQIIDIYKRLNYK